MTKLNDEHYAAMRAIIDALENERREIPKARMVYEQKRTQYRSATNAALRAARELHIPLPKSRIYELLNNKNYDNLEARLAE